MRTVKTFIVLGSMLALAGCDMMDNHPATLPPPGHYEHNTSSTNAAGTSVDRSRETDVTVDENGNRHATVKETTTTDPEGLFNSRTNTSTRRVDER